MKLNKINLIILKMLFGVLWLNSCAGGGTVGTSGGTDLTVRGSLRLADGSPIANAEISAVLSGNEVLTNSEGGFQLSIENNSQQIELLIGIEKFSSIVSLGNFPNDTQTVYTELVIDSIEGDISIAFISVNAPPNTDTESDADADQHEQDENQITSFQGSVLSFDGRPVSGVKVFVDGRSQIAFTNEAGEFELRVRRIPGSATIVVEDGAQRFRGSVRISNIPNKDALVNIVLVLEDISNAFPPAPPAVLEIDIAVQDLFIVEVD